MRLQSFIAFAVTASVSLSVPTAALAQQPQQAYTGRQIFEGAFFGMGPLAANRPGLRGGVVMPPPGEPVISARGLRALEDGVQRVDAAYFRELGPQLTSGNPAVVQAAVARTQANLRRLAAATRSGRALDVAYVDPVIGNVVVQDAVDFSVAIQLLVRYGVFYTYVGGELHSKTHYQIEQAIASLTAELANVSAKS